MKIVLTALLTGLLLDLLFAELPAAVHPVVWMGKWIDFSSNRCLRIPARQPLNRFIGGLLLVITGLALFCLPIAAIARGLSKLPWLLNGIVTGILLKPVFTLKGLLRAAGEIYTALNQGDLAEARRLTAWHLVSRDTSTLSVEKIASAAIESVAENLTDSFITPLLAFMIGGLPLAWGFRFINTADAMIGYHSEKWEMIGKAAARLDDLLNLIPAPLSGALICLAAPFSKGDFINGWRVMLFQRCQFQSPNAGWTIGATAGALDIQLEKQGAYRVNASGKEPGAADIRKSCRIVGIAGIIGFTVAVLLFVLLLSLNQA
jgi:adenosylcobinamide-phosphate synthase